MLELFLENNFQKKKGIIILSILCMKKNIYRIEIIAFLLKFPHFDKQAYLCNKGENTFSEEI